MMKETCGFSSFEPDADGSLMSAVLSG